jgi:hypothetical protein
MGELIVVFAILTAVLAVFVNVTSSRAAAEVEQTIRQAIERGVLTDASLIPKLREPTGLSAIERFNLLGMMTLFASGGIVLVALVLIVSTRSAPTPLFAIAVFLATLGSGLIACASWLKRSRRTA